MLKQVSLSLFAVAVLTALPSVLPTQLANVALAQETESVKVPAMRNRVYAQLARAQKLADEGDRIEGFNVLDEVKEQIDSLNSYEKAMLFNFYGFMHYGAENYAAAMDSFENVVKQEAIPASLRLSTLYSLAQLAMQQEKYDLTLSYLAKWQKLNDKDLTSSQEMLFAQVYYQNKDYKKSQAHVLKAISIAKAAGENPKENWLILQRANYFELKQPVEVTKVIEELIRLYDKPQYWLQLAGMYGEIGQEEKQLAVMESAFQAGYVTKATDIITLVQLYSYHGVPYKAAKLLDDSIKAGVVNAEEKYFDMLAQAYTAAKNDEKAIPVLKKAAEIADSGKYDERLALAYLNSEKWQLAIEAANKALARGGLENIGNMHLVKGMSLLNLQHYDRSLAAFAEAEKIADTSKRAKEWASYVENMRGEQLRLAALR